SGRVKGLRRENGVHFWIEALEPDFVPLNLDVPGSNICQGVKLNEWGRPVSYNVYKNMPSALYRSQDLKTIDAENMLHLKFTRRLHQLRGHSLLSGILIRLSALKDYEDAELTAARIAASLGMYIKKGDIYSTDNEQEERELNIEPGIIFDELAPGEDIGMVKSDRPNPNLQSFRNGQLRAVAAGSRGSYSSISRDYDGTYSAQR
ncbi:phage portal protein, partial [Morganella morganii]